MKKNLKVLILDNRQTEGIRKLVEQAARNLGEEVEIATIEVQNTQVSIPREFEGYLINPLCVNPKDLELLRQEQPKSYLVALRMFRLGRPYERFFDTKYFESIKPKDPRNIINLIKHRTRG